MSARPFDPEIACGYTLGDLHRITLAACTIPAATQHDAGDRYAAARGAILDALLTAGEPPTRGWLVSVGRRAILDYAHRERHHHGVSDHAAWEHDTTMRGFARYWNGTHVTGDHAPAIIDAAAVGQIFPKLTRRQREAITALAAFGDYQAAADSLGLSYTAFGMRLATARGRFKRLWHEGEAPSRSYQRDQRRSRSVASAARRAA